MDRGLQRGIILSLLTWQKYPHRPVRYSEEIPRHLEEALAHQTDIEWFQFMLGFISTKIVSIQRQSYTDVGSMRTGDRWATNLIKRTWKICHNQWLHCNNALHNTSAIHDLSRLSILQQAIQIEFETGQDTLPDMFAHHFRGTADRILMLPTERQILWFQLIKLAHKTMNTDNNFNIISVNGVLQQWIMLPPKR